MKLLKPWYILIFGAFVLLSGLMIFIMTMFKSESLLDAQQSIPLDQLSIIYKDIIKPDCKSLFWYRSFFAVDFLWPISFLCVLGLLVHIAIKKSEIYSEACKKKLFLGWLLCAILAYGSDVIENILYLNAALGSYVFLVKVKELLYGLSILGPLVIYELGVKNGLIKRTGQFLRSSYLSLLVIGVVGFLMALLEQGATIMIHLLSHPLSTIVGFSLINFLALVISHYPIFLFIKNADRGKKLYRYDMEGDDQRMFGVIYYIRQNKSGGIPASLEVGWDLLGVGLLLTWSTAMVFAFKSSFIPLLDIKSYFSIVGIIVFIYYLYRREGANAIKNSIKSYVSKDDKAQVKFELLRTKIKKHLIPYILFWLLWLVTIVVLLVGVCNYQWTQIVNIRAIIVSIINVILFIEVRLNRYLLRYTGLSNLNRITFGKGKLAYDFDVEYFSREESKISKGKFFDVLSKLSHNLTFLKTVRGIGSLALIYFLAVNYLSIHHYNCINPFNILCAFMIVVYGTIILYIKHLSFHATQYQHAHNKSDDDCDLLKVKRRNYRTFKYYIPAILILVMGVASNIPFNKKLNNLEVIPVSGEELSLNDYVADFIDNNPGDTIISIASDGGGLKANLWNLLVLTDTLNSNPEFLNNVLSMSAVSGGALGLGNFLPLHYDNDVYRTIDDKIDSIGNTNILSIDFSGVFIRDWFMHRFSSVQNRSRSYFAMRAYQKVLGIADKMDTLSYQSYWKKLYDKPGKNVPMLIMNSTSTSHEQGYAWSVDHGATELPNNIDILNHPGDSSLSYYNAVSTTNRFPIASPAAQIQGKGYFVDGGYFENSGLQVAQDVYDRALSEDLAFKERNYKHSLLNIRNGKGDWTRLFIEHYYKSTPNTRDSLFRSINKTQDNVAILQALVSLDKNPELLREKHKMYDHVEKHFIAMPYPLTINDIRAELKGEITIDKDLIDAIRANNEAICNALKTMDEATYEKYGVVTPPLARLLGPPVVFYQRAMVESQFYVPK